MDIGKITNNTTFYKGYEYEPKISLTLVQDPTKNIQIWQGYFDDIFSSPSTDGNGWKGFTKDYHQFEGAFSEEGEPYILSSCKEYYEDLASYDDINFRYEESKEVLELMKILLSYAIESNDNIRILLD